ncbi:IS3 family transposase [Stenotrophomonas sp. AB1(2024)]|uniref:IS3 family transposase n=1 Tax=Stenotrophomonas sp. AB1(2024) TaxID=3132215 RepID=UPI0038FB7B80
MIRYDRRFKLKVAREGAASTLPASALAGRYGLDRTMVHRWIETYRQHGQESFVGLRGRRYSPKFKVSVLKRMERDGLSVRQAMVKFGIGSATAIKRWRAQYDLGGMSALAPVRDQPRMKKKPAVPKRPEDMTPKELLKELEYLRAENAFLKKLRCLDPGRAGDRARTTAQAVQGLRHEHQLSLLLKAATLSRSTFYYQVQVAERPDGNAKLKREIKTIYHRHEGRYGYRRIAEALRTTGKQINRKVVQRLMRLMGLKSIVRVKKYRSYRGSVGTVAPNHLDRNFQASQPNQKWVTDVTEFNVGGKRLYLSPIMDLFNAEIVAYQISTSPKLEMIKNMLGKAFRKLEPGEAPLLHSDQGWQYQHPTYQRLLADRNISQSMSRKGNCFDNAAMESFFGTLKEECFRLKSFASVDELKRGLDGYIRYYNHTRIKLGLNGMSPVQYRTQASVP